MTASATEFVTPLTLQALSGNRVHLDLLDTEAEAAMGHIELARWADLVLIAPATANSIARIVHGEADDTVPLAAVMDWARPQRLPVTVVPAVEHFFHGQLPLLKSLVSRHVRAPEALAR